MGKSHLYHCEEQGPNGQFAKRFLSFYLGPFAKLNMEGQYGSHNVVRDAQTKEREEMSSLTRTIAICSGGFSHLLNKCSLGSLKGTWRRGGC